MTIHAMRLSKSPFEKIVSGKKIIESRLYDEKRQQIKVGDKIEFSCNDELAKKIVTKIKALYVYESFECLFSDFHPEHFGGKSKNELLKEIETFYSKEEQKKYGVVGIKIELI